MFTLLDLCVSSLRRGYANLLCIVPMLTDDRKSPSSGPSEPCVGLDCPLVPPILPLPYLRRHRVCACIRLDMFSLSLSLSLYLSPSLSLSLLPLDVSVYLSILFAHHPSYVSAKKAETGAKLTAP